jgi:small subunit ribosomal protein S17
MATSATTEAPAKRKRGLMKTEEGIVSSNKMNKSVVVSIVSYKKHPTFGKYVRRTKKYMAHDEKNECQIGDRVRIVETRPLSKNKRFRVQKILERAA